MSTTDPATVWLTRLLAHLVSPRGRTPAPTVPADLSARLAAIADQSPPPTARQAWRSVWISAVHLGMIAIHAPTRGATRMRLATAPRRGMLWSIRTTQWTPGIASGTPFDRRVDFPITIPLSNSI